MICNNINLNKYIIYAFQSFSDIYVSVNALHIEHIISAAKLKRAVVIILTVHCVFGIYTFFGALARGAISAQNRIM